MIIYFLNFIISFLLWIYCLLKSYYYDLSWFVIKENEIKFNFKYTYLSQRYNKISDNFLYYLENKRLIKKSILNKFNKLNTFYESCKNIFFCLFMFNILIFLKIFIE